MSDTTIFVFGVFVFLLLFGGLIFTVMEMRRIGEEADAKQQSNRASVPILPVEKSDSR